MTGVATSLREHGVRIGELEPGPRCSIADVGGVRVGHVTVVRDEPVVVRTGVTAIVTGATVSNPLRAARRCSTAPASWPARCRWPSGA